MDFKIYNVYNYGRYETRPVALPDAHPRKARSSQAGPRYSGCPEATTHPGRNHGAAGIYQSYDAEQGGKGRARRLDGHLRYGALRAGDGRTPGRSRRSKERRHRNGARRETAAEAHPAREATDAGPGRTVERGVAERWREAFLCMWTCWERPTWWGGSGRGFAKTEKAPPFEYDEAWLAHPSRFSLEPALKLGPGPSHTPSDKPLFGALGDSAPDRWGRALMRRAERRRAERAGETPRTLWEIDYLLMVNDEVRQGALRFAESEGGPFLAQQAPSTIPPLIELPRLLSAAARGAA